MRDGTGRKRIVQCVSLALFLAMLAVGFSEVLLPETGKQSKKNGGLTIDFSNKEEGYVLVKAAKGKKKLKVRMTKEKNALNYDLNNNGEFEVFPLQYGKGNYTFTLYKNISGKKYAEDGKITVKAEMKDATRCFLYPNQYINYDADTVSVVEATELCKDMTEQKEIFQAVCKYMKTNFAYDFLKAASVKPGQLPDIEGAWKKHMGICQDLSAIMVSMLRSQGVPARMDIGTLGSGTYHAWVTAFVDGEETFFDPTAELNGVNKKETYTLERYY